MKKKKQQKPDITRKSALKRMKKAMRDEGNYMRSQGLASAKENKQSSALGSPEEIALATKIACTAGCSVEKALSSLRTVRKRNDAHMAEMGYRRTENTPDGIAMFSQIT